MGRFGQVWVAVAVISLFLLFISVNGDADVGFLVESREAGGVLMGETRQDETRRYKTRRHKRRGEAMQRWSDIGHAL